MRLKKKSNHQQSAITDHCVEAATSECPKHAAPQATPNPSLKRIALARGRKPQAPFSVPQPLPSHETPAQPCHTHKRHSNQAQTSTVRSTKNIPHLTRHGLLVLRLQGLLPPKRAVRQHRLHEVLYQQLHRVLLLHHLPDAAAFHLHHLTRDAFRAAASRVLRRGFGFGWEGGRRRSDEKLELECWGDELEGEARSHRVWGVNGRVGGRRARAGARPDRPSDVEPGGSGPSEAASRGAGRGEKLASCEQPLRLTRARTGFYGEQAPSELSQVTIIGCSCE